MSDGRNVDARLGLLAGEAAGQAGRNREPDPVAPDAGYRDLPVLKQPVWIWTVPAYLYAGGAAGAAAVLGAVAQMDGEDGRLVMRCRSVAAAGCAAGAGLLVADLGRPERFLNMLRVFRPTSAMNMGSWVLATAGAGATASVVFKRSPLGDAAGVVAGLAGLPLAGYTAVLLADTAVPVWRESRRLLPAVFVASSASSAASLVEAGSLSVRERRAVRIFGVGAKAAELAAITALERSPRLHGAPGRPLREGLSGSLWRASKAATAAALALSVVPERRTGRLGALLGTAGSLALRFALWHAGRASARSSR